MAESKKVVRTKAYKAIMSKGDDIKLNEEEVDKVIEGCANGNLIVVNQGMINPSYLISVVADGQRISDWERTLKHGHGQGEINRSNGIRSLENIFEGSAIGRQLEERKQKLLGD